MKKLVAVCMVALMALAGCSNNGSGNGNGDANNGGSANAGK
ncbi:MAG: BMP family ABC transporter substrate-binding protein, partial [Dielma fastidiosa]